MRIPVSVILLWIDFHDRMTVNSSRWDSGIVGSCSAEDGGLSTGDADGPTRRRERPTHGNHLNRPNTVPTADSEP